MEDSGKNPPHNKDRKKNFSTYSVSEYRKIPWPLIGAVRTLYTVQRLSRKKWVQFNGLVPDFRAQ